MIKEGSVVRLKPTVNHYPQLKKTRTYLVRSIGGKIIKLKGELAAFRVDYFNEVEKKHG
ncbi:hypothetical protein HOU66_gp27 [Pectobacterium phage Arno160]|uniref:Uncharacterized protein n=1 Tax=Pectobacterium phage Arno160 TaxID=2488835 RepID=A0A3G8F2E5_9CAUD|nr:hypothetical protein HOU66_gp27 [Pectobacterium phage Arno160]AZF88089.1 hypothetical protein Arno160_gp27 [Pectobacterium phage Arno160]